MKNIKTILITGASSGIGKALATHYAAPGRILLLTGRDAGRLAAVAESCRARGAMVDVAVLDVEDRESCARQILGWDDQYPVDILIANAGISGGSGSAAPGGEDLFSRIIRTNLDGTFHTVEPLIPRLRLRGQGQIALMGSMAGFRGLPGAVAYSVSKNAVRAYAEALRPLLAPSGVGVSVICPGFIRTPLTDVNTFPMPFLIEPEEAARRIARGLASRRAVIAFPWQMHVLMRVLLLLPRAVSDRIVARAPRKD